MNRPAGKVALITGTAGGQGEPRRCDSPPKARSPSAPTSTPTARPRPHLVARGGGAILLVGPTADTSGLLTDTRIAHTATKGGVVAMTRQLAAEGAAHGIRANCISPGMIRTPATESGLLAADHPMRDIARHIPLGRVGTPEEILLAFDEASFLTGANLVVDGGWTAVLPGAF